MYKIAIPSRGVFHNNLIWLVFIRTDKLPGNCFRFADNNNNNNMRQGELSRKLSSHRHADAFLSTCCSIKPSTEKYFADMDRHVVLVNGSGSIKAGFNAVDVPTSVFPNLTARPQYPAWLARCELHKVGPTSLAWAEKTATLKDSFVGEEAQTMRGICLLTYPVQRGIVEDWGAMEQIWRYTFSNQLGVKSHNHNVLLTEAPLNPASNRTRLFEVMFEKFKVPGFYVENPAWLALLSSSIKTGLVLHVGDGVSHTLAIYEGFEIAEATLRTNLGGRDVTRQLTNRLLANASSEMKTELLSPSNRLDYEVMKEIKEKGCFVLKEAKDLVEQSNVRNCVLPDGRSLSLGNERFESYEVLFKPELLGSELTAVHKLLLESLDSCEMDVRKALLENIVVCGGATLAPGFIDRLMYELKWALPSGSQFNVVEHSKLERHYASWIGGSTLSSLSLFQDQWITKAEHDEFGTSILNRKCWPYGCVS